MIEGSNRKKFWFYSIMILAFGIIIHANIHYEQDKRMIRSDYKITKGRIVKYSSGGVDIPPTVRFSYFADGYIYERTISVSHSFEDCQDFELCKRKRYWVIYSPKDPFKCLINLSISFGENENPTFPESLNEFELPTWSRKRKYRTN